jgi:XRE family transcriptional regulator, regulator of sulfur utilization
MSEVQLGASLRQLRTAKQLSLRSLAERTGFSASFLSQVENGQASPSIASMERIAAALGVTMGQFFQTTESSPPAVLRATERVTLNSQWSKARIEALGADVPAGRIEPVLITLDAGGTSGAHPHSSPREEFAFVLDGSVVLTLAETEQVLECGDAAMIRAGVPRRWQNLGEGPVRIVVVSAH